MKLGLRLDLPLLVSAALVTAIAACGGDPASTTEGAGATASTDTNAGGGGQGGEGGEGGLFQNGGSGGGTTTTTSTSTTTTTPSNPNGLCESPNPTDPAPVWAKKAGAADVQSALGIASDAQGNVIVVGAYQGAIDLGLGALTSTGKNDAYIAKLNSSGTAVWAKSYGEGTQHQYAQHVATDAQGNLFTAGHFRGTINFGGGNLADVSNFFEDLFVAKLDTNGGHVWSKRYGDINNEESQAIATDKDGNVVVVGAFQKSIDFGNGAIIAEDGGFNAFVAKLSGAGMQQWAKSFGDTVDEQKALGVATDKDGNVVVVGSHKGSIDFGGGPLVAEAGHQNAYVVKLTSSGAHVWSKTYGTDTAAAVDVAVDAGGNVYALGNFKGSINLGDKDFSAGIANNVFVVKLDAAGAHVWSRNFGESNSAEEATSLALDGDKPVILGAFTGKVDFGGGSLASAGGFDIFMAKLDSGGCHVHSSAFGDPALQRAETLAIDPTGNILFGGSFAGAVTFGGIALAAEETDAYFVKTKP